MDQIVCKINHLICSPDFVSQHRRNDKDFTRKRSLTFPRLISFMLNMVNGSIQSELSRLFQVLDDKYITSNTVTAAAFCKARKKISFSAFKAINSCLIDVFYKSTVCRTWKGFRLLAVDGSIAILPESKELYEHFGRVHTDAKHPGARLSQLYDIGNQISVDVQIASPRIGERVLAMRHLEYANSNDLVLYDRGYPATWLFNLHIQKNVNFVARAAIDSSHILRHFLRSGELATLYEFPPAIEKSLKKCKEYNIPTMPMDLRLIRIELPDGAVEILITSLLDDDKYPHNFFKELYHQRWFVEEDYKIMKSRLQIENFSGFSVEAIKQDIHAKVVTKNIAAVAIIEAEIIAKEKYKNRKRSYKINFSFVLSQLKDNIIRFTLGLDTIGMIEVLIERISSAVNAIRPGRQFERIEEKIKKRRRKYYMGYKRVG